MLTSFSGVFGVGTVTAFGSTPFTDKAFNCGAFIPKSGISICTVFGLIEALTFISKSGSCVEVLLISP